MKNHDFLLSFLVFSLTAVCFSANEPVSNPPNWESAVVAFEKEDATNKPAKGGVEFIGSSTIRRWTTLATDYPDQPVFNRGFGGSCISDSTLYASRLIFPYEPRAIFFHAGANDLSSGKTPEQVFADFKAFVSTVHAKLPDTDIYFISLRACPARWKQHEKENELNQLISNFVQGKPHLRFIDTHDLSLGSDGQMRHELFVEDGVHFNERGYRLLIERVRPYLNETSVSARPISPH